VVAEEPVRIDLMKSFGYFVTESSGHASEYLPYFRKSERMVEDELVPRFTDGRNGWFGLGRTGGYLQHCIQRLGDSKREIDELVAGRTPLPTERTHEYGSFIIEAMETDVPIRVNGNVPNRGSITNLPDGCCVEVPCLVDANGVQATHVGALPTQLAALNRTNVNVQELIVEAALGGDPDAVHHAVALDPLTAAVCTLPQIHAMVAEMLERQAHWLPQFARRPHGSDDRRRASARPVPCAPGARLARRGTLAMARGDARAATDRATDRPRIVETAPSSPACIGPSPSSRCCWR
jgi:alpha-galactosidase